MTNLQSKKKQLKVCILDMHHHKLTCKLWPFILCKAGVDTQQLVVYLFTSRFSALQYRSEISGQRTRKTHAPFLRKRVLKNACFYTRLRAFDARVFFCYSLTSMAFFSFFSQQKARQEPGPTNTAKNISADKQICRYIFGHAHGVDKRPTFTRIFLLWTECKRKQY